MPEFEKMPYQRVDFPYAPDGEVLSLLERTHEWVVAHGHCFLPVTMSPPVKAIDNTGNALELMVGSGPVHYEARVTRKSLESFMPGLSKVLRVGAAGLTVMYDEAYFAQSADGSLQPWLSAAGFQVQPCYDGLAYPAFFTLMRDAEGGAWSAYTANCRAVKETTELELKTVEVNLLTSVMGGLERLARRHPTRRRRIW